MRSYNIYCFGSSVLFFFCKHNDFEFHLCCMSLLCSFFLFSNNSPFYRETTLSLSSHKLMNKFWLLRIMLLGIFTCEFLYEYMFLFLLGTCLGVELLGQMINLGLAIKEIAYLPKWSHHVAFPPAVSEREFSLP